MLFGTMSYRSQIFTARLINSRKQTITLWASSLVTQHSFLSRIGRAVLSLERKDATEGLGSQPRCLELLSLTHKRRKFCRGKRSSVSADAISSFGKG